MGLSQKKKPPWDGNPYGGQSFSGDRKSSNCASRRGC